MRRKSCGNGCSMMKPISTLCEQCAEHRRAYFRTYNATKRDYKAYYAHAAPRRRASRVKYYRGNRIACLALSAQYKRRLRKATPPWSNRFLLEEAYQLAKLRTEVTGIPWHVDHVIPLRGEDVCGLHVETNLAVVPAVVNIRKGNRRLDGAESQAG